MSQHLAFAAALPFVATYFAALAIGARAMNRWSAANTKSMPDMKLVSTTPVIRRLFLAYSATRPCKIISDRGQPYLERYFVCAMFGLRLYLHRFVGSDPDRGLHDHPWRWAISFILLGWYYEATRSGTRKVRWLNVLTGDTFHRVILLPGPLRGINTPREVWSLFLVPAKDVKEWGFLRDKGRIGQVFTPLNYGSRGKPAQWWTQAPKGRDAIGRQKD
ncbi:hypothetical protein [Cupriavidus pampae]|uniref:Uncharacterized protein n=1 Tax=Cupriavidus pampae TaxID=659251 RepID=A0ABM8XCE6_9BURK|nr:hypothetical protein [Cupriavidus pampae]CAG9177615.1 hypothetical protein LMG32289_03857 [Cupriavidus pampae]